MKRLTTDQIVQMHSDLIAESGGLDGVRDSNMLESAINAAFHTFDGHYVYPTLQAKAARLAYSLVKNHAFVDGNKRIGILSMLVFLQINSLEVSAEDDELISLGLGLADGSVNEQDLIRWIIAHC